MPRAGRYRHRIGVQTASEVQSASGEVTQTFATVAEKWASIWPKSAGEQVQAFQTEGTVTHEVRWRYDENLVITTKAQVVFKGAIYRILGFHHDSTVRIETIATCEEITN